MRAADLITWCRVVLTVPLIFLALADMRYAFLITFLITVALDMLDGFVARRRKESSEYGKKLDVLADNVVMIVSLVAVYFFNPDVVQYWRQALLVLLYYVVVQSISILKSRQPVFHRSLPANAAAVLFPFVIVSLVLYESQILIYTYLIIMLMSLTDKLRLQLNSKNMLFGLLLLLIIVLLALPRGSSQACFGETCIDVEVKQTPEERAVGLMYRESLAQDEGMLFIFEEAGIYPFWMPNMNFAIDMIFIDEDAQIVYIHHSVPPCEEANTDNCPRYPPDEPALYVVETVAGFAKEHGIEEGDEVEFRL